VWVLSVLYLVEELREVQAFDECSCIRSNGCAFGAVAHNEGSSHSGSSEDVCLHVIKGVLKQLRNIERHLVALLRNRIILRRNLAGAEFVEFIAVICCA
jgi:hypothetical protein